MKKDLVKLALAGLAAGLCISAQSGKGSEIAMTKCSKSPSQDHGKSSCSSCSGSQGKHQQEDDPQGVAPVKGDQSSCGSSSGSSACGSSSDSDTCSGQGDQSSQNEKVREGRKVEAKRLSAAKTVVE